MKLVKNYSLMLFKSIAMVMLVAFTFASCKKDKDTPPPPAAVAIEGLYAGKYGFGNDVPDAPEKYRIIAGGTFQRVSINNGSVVGNGTWLLNGNTLTATVTSIFAPYNKESISTTFNSATGKLTGTWGWETNYINGGKIELTKQ